MAERLYVVMKLRSWEGSLEPVGLHRLPFLVSMQSPEPHCVGFLCVFDNYGAALKLAGDDANIINIVREKE